MAFRKFSEQFAVPKKNFGTLLPPYYLKTYDFSGWLSIRNEVVHVSEKTVQISKRFFQEYTYIPMPNKFHP